MEGHEWGFMGCFWRRGGKDGCLGAGGDGFGELDVGVRVGLQHFGLGGYKLPDPRVILENPATHKSILLTAWRGTWKGEEKVVHWEGVIVFGEVTGSTMRACFGAGGPL